MARNGSACGRAADAAACHKQYHYTGVAVELPRDFASSRRRLQERQLILAGAHLAQLLTAVPP